MTAATTLSPWICRNSLGVISKIQCTQQLFQLCLSDQQLIILLNCVVTINPNLGTDHKWLFGAQIHGTGERLSRAHSPRGESGRHTVWASLGALQWQETVRTIRQRRALVLRNSPLRLWPVPMALVAWKESCCRTQQCLDQSTIFWLTLATWAQACTNHGIPFGQYSWLQICNGADAWSWIPNNARVSNNLCSR